MNSSLHSQKFSNLNTLLLRMAVEMEIIQGASLEDSMSRALAAVFG